MRKGRVGELLQVLKASMFTSGKHEHDPERLLTTLLASLLQCLFKFYLARGSVAIRILFPYWRDDENTRVRSYPMGVPGKRNEKSHALLTD